MDKPPDVEQKPLVAMLSNRSRYTSLAQQIANVAMNSTGAELARRASQQQVSPLHDAVSKAVKAFRGS